MSQGAGSGLSDRYIGEQSGTTDVTLIQSQMPFHNHNVGALDAVGDNPVPSGTVLARYPGAYQSNVSQNLNPMAFQSLSIAGGSLPHNNMPPYTTLNFIIALQGVYPARG
jgi:microcystin-dependent protein